MRLVDIVEALDPISKWNQLFSKLIANPPRDYFSDNEPQDEAGKEQERKRIREGWLGVRKAIKFHAANFNGKRWPELEQVLLMDGWTDNPTLIGYLNSITEDWPEGQQLLTSTTSSLHGTNQGTIDYLLKKNLRSPNLDDYYKGMIAAKGVRRQLNDRLQRFQNDMELKKKQLAELPPPAPAAGVLDDRDEFEKYRGIQLTIKQFENRIKTIQQTLALPDDKLVHMVLADRPKAPATREALGLPWAPPNLVTYVDKWGLR